MQTSGWTLYPHCIIKLVSLKKAVYCTISTVKHSEKGRTPQTDFWNAKGQETGLNRLSIEGFLG